MAKEHLHPLELGGELFDLGDRLGIMALCRKQMTLIWHHKCTKTTFVFTAEAARLPAEIWTDFVEDHVPQLGVDRVARVQMRLDWLVAALLRKYGGRQLHHICKYNIKWQWVETLGHKLLWMPQTSSISPSYVSWEHMGVMRSTARSMMMSDSNSGVVTA